MRKSDFNYRLPGELIAQAPLERREASRLLQVRGARLEDGEFVHLPQLLSPDDLLIVNNTRVVNARLGGRKDSGGHVEILLEQGLNKNEARCQVRASKPLKAGRRIETEGGELEVIRRIGQFYDLRFPEDVLVFLERFGRVPLPPYIEREATEADAERYQTLFGRAPGAVAAPTAGLHFSHTLLDALAERGIRQAEITLHVGAGTFQPVRVDDLSEHRMHFERFCVPRAVVDAVAQTRERGGSVVAVGTTVVRALESAARNGVLTPGPGETDLFITPQTPDEPGFRFRVVDRLVTNFHLPESTLLMLVCAFGGYHQVMQAYHHAVKEGYRFFSYGDAMLLEGAQNAGVRS